jgi:hypothetical protein
VLTDLAHGEPMVLGLALVATSGSAPISPAASELVSAISRQLLEAGDTIPLA